ncbi:GGDEF domain-containing protein [Gottfriedia luciferensis]|uniref:GGDEF domain-containing protein n=1 Tax=Gottfriedia luciferensis TaxID=178774 RepID=UPI001302B97A|nr:GGDEF domain-containing protein [Gottfriedia luciferensis]
MYLYLDTKILVTLLCMGFLFTLIITSAYALNHKKDLTFKTFFIAKCFQSLGLFCMVFRGEIPDFLSIFLTNSLLIMGTAFEVIALFNLQTTLSAKTKKFYFFLTLFILTGLYFIFMFYSKENIRIAYYSIVTAIILFPIYKMVFDKTSTILMKIIGSFYLLVIAASLVRGVTALLSHTISTSFYTPGAYQLISLLTIYLIINLGNIGFILLMKEKVDFQLIHLASYDDLTGTLNRRAFTEYAEQSLTNYAKKGQAVSYMLFDVDNFKTINDTYGHLVGDKVLQDLTTRIKLHLGKDDLFVRYGGDEFGILFPGKNEAESNEIAKQINQLFNEASKNKLPVTYTISIGVLTFFPDQNTQLENIYSTCDMALYKAKTNGRNGIFRSQTEKFQSIS